MSRFVVPIHLSTVTIDYYSTRGNNQYFEYSIEYKAITKGFKRSDCLRYLKMDKFEVPKLVHKVSMIQHIKFLSRGVV